MFLFKNTKNLAKRIVMNIAVYGWIGVFVTMLLTIILPDNFSEIFYYLIVISSFSALIGTVVSIAWPIVEFFIYIFSGSKDLSKPGTDVEKQIKKKTNSTLTKEVVVFSRPLNSCTGKIEPTDFIIRIFPDKVEILWGVGWRGGTSHADGAGDVEILDADYFEKHTIDDFITLLEATHWGKDFVKWFDIKNNEKITNLFAEYTISYQDGRFRQLAPKYKLLFCLNKENDELSKLLNGKVRKEYEDMYAVYIDSENGTCILSHAILIQLGAASTDEVVYAKVISFDEMKHLLSYEIDCLKSLAAKQKNDGIHNESIELRCKEIEKIINASPADLRKIISEENENRYTCERCKKVISESESALTDNHRFCKKCASPTQNSDKHLKNKVSDTVYPARMDFERGGSPSFESSLGNRGMFTCSNCHNVLPQKYLHSNDICASCANELNIQTVKPVKNSYLDIKLGEKFDGGFTEYYIYLRKDIKGYYIHESSWHYNAGTETHISTKYLDDSQIKSFSFDIFIRFIKAQYPEYEIDDEYLKDNIDLLRVFKKEKICQSGLDEETFQEGQNQSKTIRLFYYKKDESEWYQIELQFNENHEASIVNTYYWPAVRGGSNGGQSAVKLDPDYFTKNSIDDFIAFLTNKHILVKQFNRDFSDLKKRDDIKALFVNSNAPSNSTSQNIDLSKPGTDVEKQIKKKTNSALTKNVLPQKYLHSNGICASCAVEVTQPSRKVEEVFYKAIGKCSNCGEALSMSHQNDSLCISCEWAQDKSSDNREIFKMRTNDNRYLDFSYSGHSRYSPNHSSSNGYGSDDWMYLCEKNGTRFLLMFSDNAEYGTGWMYTELLIGDSERLIKENADYWISIAHSKERTKTYLIHLTEIDSVRHLLPTSSRCQSKLTDEHYLR